MTKRSWLLLPPLLLGLLVLAFAVRRREEPRRDPPGEVARVLRVLEVPRVELVPRVLGYGTAQPGRVWRAIAEVSGRATWVHEELRAGGRIAAGADIVHIDSSRYALSAARIEAECEQARAQLAELETQETNLRRSLELERGSLELTQRDLARVEELRSQGTATARELDQAERTVLTQQASLQSLENQLNLLPSQEKALAATLAVAEARLAETRLDLAKTVIRAPFTCRIGSVQLEVGQFLAAGAQFAEASGVERAEVEAQVIADEARILLRGIELPRPLSALDSGDLGRLFGLQAIVRFQSGTLEASWEGSLARVRERLDQDTRSVSFVIEVEDPYGRAVPGVQPPLVSGMFCEVELRGRARPEAVIIPRAAIRDGAVYLVDAGRLARRPVELEFVQGDLARIRAGLEGGETLIVSDPTPAIEGMLVEAVPDAELRERLLAQARGAGALR